MNVAKKINKRIDGIIREQEAERAEIAAKMEAVEKEIAECDSLIMEATAATDPDSYVTAKERKNRAEYAREMLHTRLNAIEARRTVTEQESDRVIDELLEHERAVFAAYDDAIREPVEVLRTLTAKHRQEVEEIETTVRRWCTVVHPNYRTFGRTRYANGSERAPYAVPVHPIPVKGSDNAHAVEGMLKELSDDGQ